MGALWMNTKAREAEHADATGGFLSVRRSEILSGFSRAAALSALLLHNLPQDAGVFGVLERCKNAVVTSWLQVLASLPYE